MEAQPPSLLEGYQAIGGLPCLDFANTLDWRASATPRELLVNGDAVAYWSSVALGLQVEPVDATTVRDLRTLREAVFRLVTRTGNADDLAVLNEALAAIPRERVVVAGPTYVWRDDGAGHGGDAVFATVARSAADLLTDGARLDRVKVCDADGCGWVFLDTSRARTRRWCSMRTCGNRNKARRHYRNTVGS